MIIKLKHYLETLEFNERFKPVEERREIPTLSALARELPITRSTLQRIVGGQSKGIQFDVIDGIIKALRRRGFPMELTDMLEFRDDESHTNGSGARA